MRNEIIGLTTIAVALLACGQPTGSSESSTTVQQAKPEKPEVTITATDLAKAYEDNEMRADSAYKGKIIEISGTVKSISSDITDEAVVTLGSGQTIMGVSVHGLSKDVAVNLNKGQDVTFVCTGAGEVMGGPMLNKCRKL